jgi:hypothetical protein
LNNKNKIKTYYIVKRIFKGLIVLSVVSIILGLFMIWYIENIPSRPGLCFVIDDLESIREVYYFLNTIIPTMIISGISGTVIFSSAALVLTNHFKYYLQNGIEKEYRISEDIFRPY